jgi:hypothetical protein
MERMCWSLASESRGVEREVDIQNRTFVRILVVSVACVKRTI